MHIAIIDYGAGNLHSVAKAFQRASDDAGLGAVVDVTDSPQNLQQASHIVLPGVGAYADCVRSLRGLDGMVEALEEAVLMRKTPFFGICVGMQMLCERGFEHGEHAGLGWLGGEVVALAPADTRLKIPHMGWNALNFTKDAHPVLRGISPDKDVYFVHSYHMRPSDASRMIATTDYGGEVCAMVTKDNIIGTQFHPEKSHNVGLRLIQNFLTL